MYSNGISIAIYDKLVCYEYADLSGNVFSAYKIVTLFKVGIKIIMVA